MAATILVVLALLAAVAVAIFLAVRRSRAGGARPLAMDPFTLQEPWRRFMQEALQARARFRRAVGDARPGPLRDHLGEIAARADAGVEECWQVATRAQEITVARRQLGTDGLRRRLENLEPSSPEATAVRAQLDSSGRLEQLTSQASDRLRLVNSRLSEAAARAIELSVSGAQGGVEALGSDVETMVDDMEALRQALEETTEAGGGGRALGTGD